MFHKLLVGGLAVSSIAYASAGVFSAVQSEDEARNLLGNGLDVKQIGKDDMEYVIRRSWWGLAKDVIIAGHDQKADFSFTVRDTVRDIKKQADELIRTLDPNYAKPVTVSPAFQYAQNLTDFNILIKYTARWNAPGAIDVGDINVTFTRDSLSFTGLGTHSSRKYLYNLDLDVFDNIDPVLSRWDAGSVGKLLITLRKRWPRKWPRLLRSKKQKISNMHVWMDRQEDFDASFDKRRSMAARSPLVCAQNDDKKFYCLNLDKCVVSCDVCEHHKFPVAAENECRGAPIGKPEAEWTDFDMTPGRLQGEVSVSLADTFDATHFDISWSQNSLNASDVTEGGGFIGTIKAGEILEIEEGTEVLPSRAFLLACPKNEYGVGENCGSVSVADAALPVSPPKGCEFKDTDKKKKEIGGTVYVDMPEDTTRLEKFSIYYGRSQKGADPERLKGSSAYLTSINKNDKSRPSHFISANTKLPRGATHFMIYSKNDHGELLEEVVCPIVDTYTPNSKPIAVHVEGRRVTMKHPKDSVMKNIKNVKLFWGKEEGCKNAHHIADVPTGAPDFATTYVIPEMGHTPPADATHLLAKHKNEHGESTKCASFLFDREQYAGGMPIEYPDPHEPTLNAKKDAEEAKEEL